MSQQTEHLEAAVITRVLERHPARVTVPELVQDLAVPVTGGRDELAVERAVLGLAKAKLLESGGDGVVAATPAAVHYGELLEA